MNNLTQSIIGWCAGLAIGMTIGVSLINLILCIGLGACIWCIIGSHANEEEKILKQRRVAPHLWGFLFIG